MRNKVGDHTEIDQALICAQQGSSDAVLGQYLTKLSAGAMVEDCLVHEGQIGHVSPLIEFGI
jgi:hypothetical protein